MDGGHLRDHDYLRSHQAVARFTQDRQNSVSRFGMRSLNGSGRPLARHRLFELRCRDGSRVNGQSDDS